MPGVLDTGWMDLSGLIVREGAVARATGRVLEVEGEVWFERPEPVPLVWPPRPPRPGRFAVRAHGVDLDRLDRRQQHATGIEGWTTLTGTWQSQRLRVRTQTSWQPPDSRRGRRTDPPCAPPPQGWPRNGEHGNPMPSAPPDDEWEALSIMQVAWFHPAGAGPVLVVSAEDPARVERLLRPEFGAALCVVPSRYTRQQIEGVARRLRVEGESRRWLISMHGSGVGGDGQPRLTVELARVVPAMAEWAATVPDGLLAVDVWLAPVT
jgi:hypothetical protein